MLLASKSCFFLLLALFVTTPYSVPVAAEEGEADDAADEIEENESAESEENESTDDGSAVVNPQTNVTSEEKDTDDDANDDANEESENEVDDGSLMATPQSANPSEEADDADDSEEMATVDEESGEENGITQDTFGMTIYSQPGLTSNANFNGFAATFRGQKQFPDDTVMSTTAGELKAAGWESSQLPGLLISSSAVAHNGEIWIVLLGKCLTILFLNIW